MPTHRLILLPAFFLLACQSGGAGSAGNPEVQAFLADYAKEYQRLNYASALAEWESNTRIVEGDSSNAIRTRRANEALARFVGSNENIAKIRGFLKERDRLSPLQQRFLAGRGLVPPDAKVDSMAQLLQEALAFVVFVPFAAGTMTRFEHALYTQELPADSLNSKWWELTRKYQGIVPPAPRDERWADGLTKTHINDDPAQYYDYALSYALLFQLHDHIAREILHQDPHNTDYYGSREVGDFLRRLMAPGASRPWRETLRQTTGRELDGKAMAEYFEPLRAWLQQQNRGRQATLPEL